MSFNKDRLAVAIGKKGETKKKLEQATGTIIHIDSNSGNYTVEADEKIVSDDGKNEIPELGVRVYMTNFVLQAINLGFNPQKALKLLDSELVLDIIDLEDVLGHSEKKLKRIKGRIIGDHGKIWHSIEQFAAVDLSVYTKYLAIIGDYTSIKTTRKAINMIIQGAAHKTVLAYLHRVHQERKREEFTQIWKPTI